MAVPSILIGVIPTVVELQEQVEDLNHKRAEIARAMRGLSTLPYNLATDPIIKASLELLRYEYGAANLRYEQAYDHWRTAHWAAHESLSQGTSEGLPLTRKF